MMSMNTAKVKKKKKLKVGTTDEHDESILELGTKKTSMKKLVKNAPKATNGELTGTVLNLRKSRINSEPLRVSSFCRFSKLATLKAEKV